MYLDNSDYQTVWKLAHNWVSIKPNEYTLPEIPADLKGAIQRLMHAGHNSLIAMRTRRRGIFIDESLISILIDMGHIRRFMKCLRHDLIDPIYLDSIYVRRGDVLRWCHQEFYEPPPIWKPEAITASSSEFEEDGHWYKKLNDKQRRIVFDLETARQLWHENNEQTYEDVYNHEEMPRPRAFTSLDAFKRWTRDFAPDFAKKKGRRDKS